MKRLLNHLVIRAATFAIVTVGAGGMAFGFVLQTEREFFGAGDFDGNGRVDVVILDKASGKYRLGYQAEDGTYNWVNYRVSGVKDATGLAVGRLFDGGRDGLVFTAADANLITVADAPNPGTPAKAVSVPFESLGPNGVAAVDVGGAGNTPLDDLVIGSIYNDPTPNKLALLRNEGGAFKPIGETEAPAQFSQANVVALKPGGPLRVASIVAGEDSDAFRVEAYSSGKAELLVEAGGLPKGTRYLLGAFRGGPLPDVVFYVPDEAKITVRPFEEAGGKLALGEARSFELGQPIRLLVVGPKDQGAQLVAIFGKGETAAVFAFDGRNAPTPVQDVPARSGDLWFGALGLDTRFLLFSGADYSKFSTHAAAFHFTGVTNAAGAVGKLASMADSDDSTVPDVQKHIVATLEREGIKAASDMKAYTNTIPGSTVTYVMLPIPGGEFVMGSPPAEADRQADEGPLHKVRVAPFWMGQYEVTWNEYEIFMYPDDEKKLRENHPTEDTVNVVSDGVTRPSKPYTEMSFGMGRDGYPAICMTQHAANKFCHWLSAKTGHYYRLPTEAEWEYACRAGTTTAFSFGGDPKALATYGWFEENSDFKYQKVGKKKPNPWGLYDMHGNVWEWCLDQYEDSYQRFTGALAVDPWTRATKPYPHVVRGGSYDDPIARLRSAARRGSDRNWKMRDPQLPKSIWWHSDAPWVGFRIVRPLQIPPPEEIIKYWTSGVEKD